MNMVEKVARAICESQDENPDATHPIYPDWRGWHQYKAASRAAVAAMREPTEAMLEAVWYLDDNSYEVSPSGREYYRAMIDTALSEPQGTNPDASS